MPAPYERDDGSLVIPMVGHPFYGPQYLGGKDVQKQYFHPGTDFGPLKQVLVYWEHNKAMDTDPLLAKHPDFAGEMIGVAEKSDLTAEEGEIWNIIVDKRYKYRNLIQKLAEKNFLNSSTHPFQRGVVLDEKTGRIDRWPTVEMTLCVTPANPDAEQYFKALIVEEITAMADEVKKEEVKTEVVVEPVTVVATDSSGAVNTTVVEVVTPPEVPVVETEKTTEVSATPMTDQAKALLEKVVATPAETEKPKEKDMQAWLDADIMGQFARVFSEIEGLKNICVAMMANSDMQKSILLDQQTAWPLLIEAIAKGVTDKIQTESAKPEVQKIAEKNATEQILKKVQPRNPSAPGRDRKATHLGN